MSIALCGQQRSDAKASRAHGDKNGNQRRTVHHVDEGLVIARVLKLCAIVEQLALRCVLVVHKVTALVLVFALVKAIGEEADFLIEGGLAAAGLLDTPLHGAVH